MRLNDGLERLGVKEIVDGSGYEGGVFRETAIESIRLPSTLRRVEAMTFAGCQNLKSVKISEGIKYIGEQCFYDSGVEEIVLPGTLREIKEYAFWLCRTLRTVFAEKGCAVDVRKYVGKDVDVRSK